MSYLFVATVQIMFYKCVVILIEYRIKGLFSLGLFLIAVGSKPLWKDLFSCWFRRRCVLCFSGDSSRMSWGSSASRLRSFHWDDCGLHQRAERRPVGSSGGISGCCESVTSRTGHQRRLWEQHSTRWRWGSAALDFSTSSSVLDPAASDRTPGTVASLFTIS